GGGCRAPGSAASDRRGAGRSPARPAPPRKGAGAFPTPTAAAPSAVSPLVGPPPTVLSLAAVAPQASACACVGALNAPVNQSRVRSLKPCSGSARVDVPSTYPSCLLLPTVRTVSPAAGRRAGTRRRP